MPIKDPVKRREYQRELMRKKRSQGLTDKNVSPIVSPEIVRPLKVSPVRPDNLVSPKMLDPVSPYEIKWKEKYLELEKKTDEKIKEQFETITRLKEKLRNNTCQLHHTTLSELFHQAQEQVKSSWQEIINQGGVNQCHNCHNSQINHQLAINLLEKYWTKSKKTKEVKNV